MTGLQHAKAALTLSLIIANLSFWCMPLVLVALLRLLAPKYHKQINSLSVNIYRAVVHLDDWFLKYISKCEWVVDKPENYTSKQNIIISNHRSWADTFLLQSAIVKSGPIIKFVCKRQLIYFPIFAIIILAYRFPVVERYSSRDRADESRRERDFERIREACRLSSKSQESILVFPEGTRYAEQKLNSSNSSYIRLLPPKAGGFSLLVEALSSFEPTILNCTLTYPPDCSFWRFLGGAMDSIHVEIRECEWNQSIQDHPADWLNERWREKDEKLLRVPS